MEQKNIISQFLDESGRITQWPRKQKSKLAALAYLAEKFETGKIYTEREINEICDRWHTFGDFFLLRRELVEHGFLDRERDGSKYWRTDKSPAADGE